MRFHKSRKRYFFFQRIGSKIILAKERGKICTRYVSLPPRSFNLDSFAMPLSFRWNQNRGFYRPVSLFSSSLPFSPPRPFFPPTRGTKMRTNQYSPTYLPRDHNLQKRNPWKNGSVPSFPQFRSPERTKPLPRQRERERENRTGRDEYPTKRGNANSCDFFTSCERKFFARRICMHSPPLPTRKSFVLRGITYRLISFSHIFLSKTTGIIVENLSSPVVAIP